MSRVSPDLTRLLQYIWSHKVTRLNNQSPGSFGSWRGACRPGVRRTMCEGVHGPLMRGVCTLHQFPPPAPCGLPPPPPLSPWRRRRRRPVPCPPGPQDGLGYWAQSRDPTEDSPITSAPKQTWHRGLPAEFSPLSLHSTPTRLLSQLSLSTMCHMTRQLWGKPFENFCLPAWFVPF